MKRIILFLILIICILTPLMAGTDGNDWGDLGRSVLLILSPILITAAAALGEKLFRKLGIDVEGAIIERVFAEILQFILKAEKTHKTATEKMSEVVDRTYGMLTKKQRAIVEKRYGSIENAVEVVFQQSSIAKKTSKT
ncbi:MAG TPA: hypothetical protein PL124_07485 [Candidatus Cloacimonadota bacterium]|nr:hypothetical protein [Candidatus Cloacimonadota bacterium]HPS39239.1 hypothetical protein [Candidatus Cloacimonadota bacterium]